MYWSLPNENKLRAPMVGDWLQILLRRTANRAPSGGVSLGHSLCVGTACASVVVGDSLIQIMHYDLWKSLDSVQHYLEHFDTISPDASVRLFFGWMTSPVSPPHTHDDPVVQQTLRRIHSRSLFMSFHLYLYLYDMI